MLRPICRDFVAKSAYFRFCEFSDGERDWTFSSKRTLQLGRTPNFLFVPDTVD